MARLVFLNRPTELSADPGNSMKELLLPEIVLKKMIRNISQANKVYIDDYLPDSGEVHSASN